MAEQDEEGSPEEPKAPPPPEPDPPGGGAQDAGGTPGPGPRGGRADDPDAQAASIINNFYSEVSANTVGVSGTAGSFGKASITRQSGSMSGDAISHALRYYLEPAPFGQALETFRRRHLIALTGPDGCGKRAGTLKLARAVCPTAGSFTVLPPTRSLSELATSKGYRPGGVYLVHDWMPGPAGAASAARFDLEQLESRLRREGAYLAITFESADSMRVLLDEACVRWSAPDPAALLDHCVEQIEKLQPSEEEHDQLRARAKEIRAPRLIIRMTEAAADDLTAALAEAQESEGSAVTAWFGAQPARWKVWSATALTFLSGVGERNFERMLTGLTRMAEADRDRGIDDMPPLVPEDEPFRQDRWRLANDAGLEPFIIKRDAGGPVGIEHRPAFHSKECRQHFMLELNRRYGDDLWTPVRDWLFELADLPFGEEQIAAGYGLALLARCALGEVAAAYLIPWSAGALEHRLMAVSVLWSMAEDDEVASAAMGIAVSWVHDRGQERAITAALALGGPLGQLHPLEAMRWLWVLALRSERVGRVARTAIGHLFAVESETGEEGSRVPRFVLRKIRPLLADGVTARERRAGLTAVNAVLAAQSTSEIPVLASSLRSRPADIKPVGELWAAVLNSVPHRRDAIRSLHATLTALGDGTESEELATGLGSVLLPKLTPRSVEVLTMTLPDPEWADEVSAAVLAAFLGTRRRR